MWERSADAVMRSSHRLACGQPMTPNPPALSSQFIVPLPQIFVGKGQFPLPATIGRAMCARVVDLQRRWRRVPLGPKHGATVVCRCGRERFLRCEGHVGWQTGQVRHRTEGHGPVRTNLFADPVAQHRPVRKVLHFAGHVGTHVGHAVAFQVQTPTWSEPGQRAVASAERPDSRLVMSEVHVLEKHTALDSAHVAMPLSSSMPRS